MEAKKCPRCKPIASRHAHGKESKIVGPSGWLFAADPVVLAALSLREAVRVERALVKVAAQMRRKA